VRLKTPISGSIENSAVLSWVILRKGKCGSQKADLVNFSFSILKIWIDRSDGWKI
jgi:hypothetical protein